MPQPLPDPVASLENVAENSAPWIARRQRHFRQSTEFGRRSFGRGIHQLVGHDAPLLLHPPLQRAQVRPAESVRVICLQPTQQRHRTGVRVFLQSLQHFAPHALEGVFPDERRGARLMAVVGGQRVQETLDLVGGPVVGNVHAGIVDRKNSARKGPAVTNSAERRDRPPGRKWQSSAQTLPNHAC